MNCSFIFRRFRRLLVPTADAHRIGSKGGQCRDEFGGTEEHAGFAVWSATTNGGTTAAAAASNWHSGQAAATDADEWPVRISYQNKK